jgi:hypothetical protein
MGDWLIAALFLLAMLLEYEVVVRWERWRHGHTEARLRPRPRRNRGRRY